MKKIRLDGYVGFDITSDGFAEEIKNANGDDIEITLNSGGGNVFTAFDIYQQMKEYPGNINLKMGGLVASAATVISSGADNIIADPVSSFMIHNASAFVDGDYRTLENASKMLLRINQHLAKQYSKITGKTEKEIYQLMNNETWLFGDEIVAEGFAHKMADGKPAVIDTNKTVAIAAAKAKYVACNKKFQENPLLDVSEVPPVAVSASMPDKKQKKEKLMERPEAINFIKSDMKPEEIAAAFNLELADKADKEKIKALADENKSLKEKAEQEADRLRVSEIKAAFPGEKNPLALYLIDKTIGKTTDEVKAIIDSIDDDIVAKSIKASMMDQDSTINIIDSKKPEEKKEIDALSGVVIM